MLKNHLKTLELLTKVIPLVLSILFVLRSTILFLYNIDIISCSIFGGIGFIPLIYLWYASYTFKFCIHLKMFIYYMLFSNILCTLDVYNYLPLEDYTYWLTIVITFGLCVIFYGILKYKNNIQINKERKFYKDTIKEQQKIIKQLLE